MAALFRQRFPFLPLLACAVAGILAAELAKGPSSFWLIAAFASAGAFFLTRKQTTFAALCFCLFALMHLWQSRESAAAQFAGWLGPRSLLTEAHGIVVSEPRSFSDKSSFELRLSRMRVEGRELSAPLTLQVEWTGPPPVYGDEVRVVGSLENPGPPRNPGQFDFAAWSARRSIYTRLRVGHANDAAILASHRGNPLVTTALRARNWMRETLTRGLDDPIASDLIIGMVLGETTTMPERIQEQFRGTGTFHLFSVSGLHVGILAALLWFAFKLLRIPRRQAAMLIIGILFFYALMTGLKPASLRATIMAAIVLLGLITSRRPVLLNNLLAAAFLILLADTNQLFNAGFQLSFCVVAAILVMERPIRDALAKPFHPDPFFPEKLLTAGQRLGFHSGQKLAALAAVSLAAWIGSLPLTLGYFHLVSFTALPANLLAVPISFGIMAVAMLSLLSGVASLWVAAIYNQTNWLLAHLLLGTISFFASLPGSFFYVRAPQVRAPLAEIVVFDFGAGGAAWVSAGGRSWLIDSGPAYQFDSVLLPFLRSRGLRSLDGLLITHGDAGHMGSAEELFASCPPRQLIDSTLDDRSKLRHRLHTELARQGIPKSLHRSDDLVVLSPAARLHVLYPPRDISRTLADDKTLIVRLEVENLRLLFMSDAGLSTEQWLLAHSAEKLPCDILIKGSSRRGPSADLSFLKAANPSVVVASAADFPASERIPDALVENLASLGIRLFRQDENGAVRIRIYSTHWEVSAWVDQRHYSRMR